MNSISMRLLMGLLVLMALTILPLPEMLIGFRPLWVLMFALYVQLYLPDYFHVAWLFFLGLCLDVLLSTILGEHSFALLLVSMIVTTKIRRFMFYTIGQQLMFVAGLCVLYQSTIVLFECIWGYRANGWFILETGLTSVLFWPWVKRLADNLLNPLVNCR